MKVTLSSGDLIAWFVWGCFIHIWYPYVIISFSSLLENMLKLYSKSYGDLTHCDLKSHKILSSSVAKLLLANW